MSTYEVTLLEDVPFGENNGRPLYLDIMMPRERLESPMPAVLYLHGGGWESGDKGRLGRTICTFLAGHGFFAVSANYTLSGDAPFPAQIHDAKAVVRWIRAHAEQYHVNPERIGATGHSSGAHLVSVLGTSAGVPELEGESGWADFSSAVQAVIPIAGPTDLLQMGGWHDRNDSPESKLVGGSLQEHPEAATKANPITYITGNEPPFLIIHGTEDAIVPYNQAELLYHALDKATLITVKKGDHSLNNGNIYWEEVNDMSLSFFKKHLVRQPEDPADLAQRLEWERMSVAIFSRTPAENK